jgi:hypothetical protein
MTVLAPPGLFKGLQTKKVLLISTRSPMMRTMTSGTLGHVKSKMIRVAVVTGQMEPPEKKEPGLLRLQHQSNIPAPNSRMSMKMVYVTATNSLVPMPMVLVMILAMLIASMPMPTVCAISQLKVAMMHQQYEHELQAIQSP